MAMQWIDNADGTKSFVNTDELLVEQACPTDPQEALQCESCQ